MLFILPYREHRGRAWLVCSAKQTARSCRMLRELNEFGSIRRNYYYRNKWQKTRGLVTLSPVSARIIKRDSLRGAIIARLRLLPQHALLALSDARCPPKWYHYRRFDVPWLSKSLYLARPPLGAVKIRMGYKG